MDPMGNETEWGLIFQYTFGISWSLVKLSTTLYVVKVLIRGWGPVDLLNFWNFHEKKPPTFNYNGWLIGIPILVYNPHIPG